MCKAQKQLRVSTCVGEDGNKVQLVRFQIFLINIFQLISLSNMKKYLQHSKDIFDEVYKHLSTENHLIYLLILMPFLHFN